MIAMQYSFTLPADYDMAIIDRRIAEKGRFTDGFPGLVFKAYCSARKAGPQDDNLYAPFYLWESCEAMNAFLCGPGFAGVSQAFGWPVVKTWSVLHAEMSGGLAAAHAATRDIVPVARYADLDEMRRTETRRLSDDVVARGALAAVTALDPLAWTLVRFRLWGNERPNEERASGGTRFSVGHVSTSA